MRMRRVLILSWIRNLRHPWLRGSSIQHVMITVWIRAVSIAGVTMACMCCRRWETRSAGESDRKLIKTRCFLVIQRKIYLNHGEHHNHMAKKRTWNHWRFVFTVGRHCWAGTMPTQAWEGSVTWEVKVTGSGVISLRSMSSWLSPRSCLPCHILQLCSGPGHYSQHQHGQCEWQSCTVNTQTPVSLNAGTGPGPRDCLGS